MADSRVLELVLTLKDQASSGLAAFSKNSQQVEKSALVTTGALTAFSLAMGGIVREAGKLEQTKVAFTTLLGSGQAATKMIRELTDFAAKTPFEMPGITNMAQRFLAAGYSAEEIIPKLRAVGDAASAMGVGQAGADQITLALTQMSARVSLSGQEMMQLAQVGINGFRLLSEQTGIAEGKIREMSERGLIPGKAAADLLAKAMSQKWGGAMENQSQTLIGLLSTLHDTIRLTATAIGGEFLESVKGLVRGAIGAVEHVGDWVKQHKELVTEVVKTVGALLILGTTVFGTIGAVTKTIELITAMSKALLLGNFQFLALASAVTTVTFVLVKLSDTFGGVSNAFQALGKAFGVVGQLTLRIFQEMANGIIGAFDFVLQKVGWGINQAIDLANKLGANIDKVDLGVKFRFDDKATTARIGALMEELDQLHADAITQRSNKQLAAAQAEAEVTKQIKLSTAELEANKKALLDGSGASKKASEEAKKLAETVTKLGEEYQDLQEKGADALAQLEDDHKTKLASIREDIKRTQDQLNQLARDYSRQQVSDTKSVAEQVVATEQRIAEIKQQLQGELSDSRRKELEGQLAKEQAALTTNADFIKSIDGAVVEARRWAGLTDLQRAIEEYQTKRALAEQEFKDKQSKLNAELLALQQKELAEIALYTDKKTKIEAMMQEATKSYQELMDKQFKVTQEKLEAEIKLYQQLAEAIAKVRGGSVSQVQRIGTSIQSVNDAIIAPGGNIITTHPDDYLIATKTPGTLGGGGVVVNVYGDVSGQELVAKVSEGIMNTLRLNSRLPV